MSKYLEKDSRFCVTLYAFIEDTVRDANYNYSNTYRTTKSQRVCVMRESLVLLLYCSM